MPVRGLSMHFHALTCCRCGPEDLAKERGPVMEEWRSGRNAAGRLAQAHWKELLKGTQVCMDIMLASRSFCVARPWSVVACPLVYRCFCTSNHMGGFCPGGTLMVLNAACMQRTGQNHSACPTHIYVYDSTGPQDVKWQASTSNKLQSEVLLARKTAQVANTW